MSDPRLNRPSASSMERLSLCPGSFALGGAQPESRSKESDSGDEAHALAALFFQGYVQGDTKPYKDALAAAPLDIADVVGRFVETATELYNRWLGDTQATAKKAVWVVEQRLVWLDKKFQPFTTGAPDLVWVLEHEALILDFKSLYGEQTESVRNPQLRTYVALVNEEFGCSEITVAIIQPRVSKEVQLCLYGPDEITDARRWVQAVIGTAEDEPTVLVPGPKQCKFCRARAVCPKAFDFTMAPTVIPERPLAKGEAGKIVALLPVADRVRMFHNKATIERILEAVVENLKELPEAELNAHGLTLEVERGNREINDVQKTWEALGGALTVEQFNACCSCGITKLEGAYRAARKLKVKETRAELEQKLGDLVGRKADKKTLARLKGDNPPPAASQLLLE